MSKLLATSPRDIYEVAVTLTENVTHCSQAPGSVRYASRSVPTHGLNAHNFLSTLCIFAGNMKEKQETDLLEDSDSEQDVNQLTINEHYAKAFEYRKEREELAKR